MLRRREIAGQQGGGQGVLALAEWQELVAQPKHLRVLLSEPTCLGMRLLEPISEVVSPRM